jgi:hypothetical protein
MNFYNNDFINGELWLRDSENNIKNVYEKLSSVFIKYKDIDLNFFNSLSSNQITRFNVFYDSIFVENQYGYIFEKIIQENSQIYPFNQFNLFNNTSKIDYWFDEKLKKVYFCSFGDSYIEDNSKIKFSILFKEFDINEGVINLLLNKIITLKLINPRGEWFNSNGIKEVPKLTYNSDTNLFNISFLLRSEVTDNNTLSLISINLDKKDIIEINAYVPFAEIDLSSSTIT